MVAIGGVFDGSILEWIARSASAVAVWASVRAHKAETDELALLTERLRHPVKFAVLHPIRAIRRMVN